jgi:hypothetical protein
MWVCVCNCNCYSKWFGGWPNPDAQPDTKKAVMNLDLLEIVWVSAMKYEACKSGCAIVGMILTFPYITAGKQRSSELFRTK